jgi:hypothetical protein
MKFELVESDRSYKVWKCGLYHIHLFNYVFDGSFNAVKEKDGYWAYYDSKRIIGGNMYQGFDNLQDAIKACENHKI